MIVKNFGKSHELKEKYLAEWKGGTLNKMDQVPIWSLLQNREPVIPKESIGENQINTEIMLIIDIFIH